MEDLHAAIAVYLRGQRGHTPRGPRGEAEPARQLFGYAEGRDPVPRCQACGRPVDDDGGLFNLADMQRRRQCTEHYCPF